VKWKSKKTVEPNAEAIKATVYSLFISKRKSSKSTLLWGKIGGGHELQREGKGTIKELKAPSPRIEKKGRR